MASRPPTAYHKSKSPTRPLISQNVQPASSASPAFPPCPVGVYRQFRPPSQRERGKITARQRSNSCKRATQSGRSSAVRTSCSMQSCLSKLAESLVQRLDEHVQRESLDSRIRGVSSERKNSIIYSASISQEHAVTRHQTPLADDKQIAKEALTSHETPTGTGRDFQECINPASFKEKTFSKFTKPNSITPSIYRGQTQNFFSDYSSVYPGFPDKNASKMPFRSGGVKDSRRQDTTVLDLPKNLRTGNTPALGVQELRRRSHVRGRIACRRGDNSGYGSGGGQTSVNNVKLSAYKKVDPGEQDDSERQCLVKSLKEKFQGQGNIKHSQLSCDVTPNPIISSSCIPGSTHCEHLAAEDPGARALETVTSPRPLVNKRWTCSVSCDTFPRSEDISPPRPPVSPRNPLLERHVSPPNADPTPRERAPPPEAGTSRARSSDVASAVSSGAASPLTRSTGIQVCLMPWARPGCSSKRNSRSPLRRPSGKGRSESPSSVQSEPVLPVKNAQSTQSPQSPRGRLRTYQRPKVKSQSPQRARTKAQSLQSSKDKLQGPQRSRDKAQSPVRFRGKAQSPQRPRGKTQSAQSSATSQARPRRLASKSSHTSVDDKRAQLLNFARRRTNSLKQSSTSSKQKAPETSKDNLPAKTTTDIVHFLEQLSKDKEAVKVINNMALLATRLQK